LIIDFNGATSCRRDFEYAVRQALVE
jgi:hypothetical protein